MNRLNPHTRNILTGERLLGAATITLAVLFNVPYALLAATFDYPAILREPASEVLGRFAEGGPALLLSWYAFAVAALSLVPLAVGLSITAKRLATWPAISATAALSGALAGLTQAIGLLRWVFVMPELSRAAASSDAATAQAAVGAFNLINAYGGVAIGEHLGQLLTAMFAGLLGLVQLREGNRITASLGLAAMSMLAVGTGEGLMLVFGKDGGLFALATIAGFLALTVWLISTGTLLLRRA